MMNHKMKWIYLLLVLLLSAQFVSAQPFFLQSKQEAKPFSLKIYYGNKGKGAFVQYTGQSGIIPLKIKAVSIDSTDKDYGQPNHTTYVWNEVVNGKITGSYGLTEGLRWIGDAWYIRNKDQRKFLLEHTGQKETYDGVNKYLLHGILIAFNHYYDDKLTFQYTNKTTSKYTLPEILQANGARQSHIDDYNFDGYDDVVFSVSDAGMGVCQQYTIYIYNPKTKKFDLLPEPKDYGKANCSCLCDVTLNKKKKLLYTACRGGARWWQDAWKFENNKLVWVSSKNVEQ